eukprot:8061975-Pyramimonas_sp.AAC.1
MGDRPLRHDKYGAVHVSSYSQIFGPAHPLIGQSKKSKRVFYSTSHAETIAAVGGSQHAQYTALRFTELLALPMVETQGKSALQGLMKMQDEGRAMTPIDIITDCYDLYQLTTGLKGIPVDKTQR